MTGPGSWPFQRPAFWLGALQPVNAFPANKPKTCVSTNERSVRAFTGVTKEIWPDVLYVNYDRSTNEELA